MRHLRNLTVAAAALAAGLLMSAGAASAATWDIDSVHTSVLFKVDHAGVAPFYGRFNKVSGTIGYDAAKPAASTFKVEIDADSVFTANKKRDDHLKSPDFFNVKQFPTITLVSRSVKPAAKPDTFTIVADLTLRGVTKTVTFEARKTGEASGGPMGTVVGFEAELTINRHDFGVSYGPDGLGKDVTLIVALEAKKKE